MGKIATVRLSRYINVPYRLDYEIEINIPKGKDVQEYIDCMSQDELYPYLTESCMTLEEIDQNAQREDRYLGKAAIIDVENLIEYQESQYEEIEEKYDFKLQELRNMMKNPKSTDQDIMHQIKKIESWRKSYQLKSLKLDEKMICALAQELRIFYEKLWQIKSKQTLNKNYLKLSNQLTSLYEFDEIIQDWKGRMLSKKNYEEITRFLANRYFLLDDLKEKIQQYQRKQIFYPERYEEYSVNLDLILQKKEKNQILIKDLRHVKGVAFCMIYCPSDRFIMGSNCEDESPMHQVKITKRFWMAETVVTQELWKAVMPNHIINDSSDPQLPVHNITWYDSLVFCNQLSRLEGFQEAYTLSCIVKDHQGCIVGAFVEWHKNANGYRLPSEAEWEYCAKAGQSESYVPNDLDEVAWYNDNSDYRLHPVKMKKPNAWGLYDIFGNCQEWCSDVWDPNIYRNRKDREDPVNWHSQRDLYTLRGGSFRSRWISLSASRRCDESNVRCDDCGLRVLRRE
jgi:formylglycine-generating enzyme required for sulfatase activity